jgi:hypothetical protein
LLVRSGQFIYNVSSDASIYFNLAKWQELKWWNIYLIFLHKLLK